MKYFAYGSNMNPDRMTEERGINFSQRVRAILKGYTLEFNKVPMEGNPREGYANLVKDENEIVEGVLYDISESDLSKLDRCEGVPDHYRRMNNVKVLLDDGREIEAITYIANPAKVRRGLRPSKEYSNHLLGGCDILSVNYCEKLRSWETLD